MRYERENDGIGEFSSIKIGDEFEANGHLYKKIPLVATQTWPCRYNAVCLSRGEPALQILRFFPGDSLVRPVAGLFKEV